MAIFLYFFVLIEWRPSKEELSKCLFLKRHYPNIHVEILKNILSPKPTDLWSRAYCTVSAPTLHMCTLGAFASG